MRKFKLEKTKYDKFIKANLEESTPRSTSPKLSPLRTNTLGSLFKDKDNAIHITAETKKLHYNHQITHTKTCANAHNQTTTYVRQLGRIHMNMTTQVHLYSW
jgi:hypothetical protein